MNEPRLFDPGPATNGLCHCGCGQRTSIIRQTWTTRGYVKGEHHRFIRGHDKRLPRPETPETRRTRIMSHVACGDASECWEWQAYRCERGYGITTFNGRPAKAHRAVYTILVGAIPEGLTLDHLCRNRGCVNPAHLEPVTAAENSLRGNTLPGINARKTHCPRGHAYDEENTVVYRGSRYCRACRKKAVQ